MVDVSERKATRCQLQHKHYSPNPNLSKSTSFAYRKIAAPDFYKEVDEKYQRVKSRLDEKESPTIVSERLLGSVRKRTENIS